MKLTDRLAAVASMVSRGNVTADVGCDHGYVSIWLAQNGICPRVIAMDVRKGPLSAAKEHIEKCGLAGYIETRLSDGVDALIPGEADTFLAAGMGGKLVVKILEEGKEKVRRMKELVLQPQSEISMVRRYLREQGYAIVEEEMVLEDGKYYPMFRALTEKGLAEAGTSCDGDGYVRDRYAQNGYAGETDGQEKSAERKKELYDTYGKLLLQRRHPVLKSFLEKERCVCRQIEASVRENAGEGKEERLADVQERQKLLEAALAWYQIKS